MSLSVRNFLSESLASRVSNVVDNLRWSYGWKSSNTTGYAHWNYDFTGGETYNGLDVSNRLNGPVLEAWNFIQSSYLQNHILVRCYANAHTYGVEGYPHTDSKRSYDTTVVLYMNKDWKREWGGETVIYNGNDITTASVPEFNKALIFKGNEWHCARGVTRICPVQRKTLMFKCSTINADPKRDELQKFLSSIGANDKAHKLGSLTNHLLGTYDLLRANNLPNDTCLAGGAHSVFGTNAFTNPCLTLQNRDKLVEVIGERATQLVELFSKISRPQCLEESLATKNTELLLSNGSTVTVTNEQLMSLCYLEAANLIDQQELAKFPGLKALWASVSAQDNI